MNRPSAGDVGWVLWAGTIGLESSISARVDAALATACTRVSIGPADVVESGAGPEDLGNALRDAGLDVVLDPVMDWYGAAPGADAGRYAGLGNVEALVLAEALGAVSISVIGPFMPDEVPAGELSERYAAFCDRAADFGASVQLEFMPMSAVPDLATAWPIVRDADRPNGGILLDTWHFFRSSSELALLEQVPGDRIFGVQVADAHAQPTAPALEETFHRLLPGDGDLDLTGLLRMLHRTGGLRWVGPEVISPVSAAMAPADAARVAFDRVRALVADAGSSDVHRVTPHPSDTGEAETSTPSITDPTTWALDREIVLVRVLDASRDAVFAAWTDADAFCQWFGPEGFTCTVYEMDVRPGGRARFDMTSGDGTRYTNRFDYLEVVSGQRLVMDHGSDVDDDPARFRVTITLDEQADGKTVLTLRQLHPSVEQRDAGIGFGAVELGMQTMQKLARHLGVA